ncbi:hypothetical protein FB451DRAFT_1410967 [Mycena latifolia]|nr:hypothetical protein FB451DRAFT_1410967 [Mycena latifolia]
MSTSVDLWMCLYPYGTAMIGVDVLWPLFTSGAEILPTGGASTWTLAQYSRASVFNAPNTGGGAEPPSNFQLFDFLGTPRAKTHDQCHCITPRRRAFNDDHLCPTIAPKAPPARGIDV